jgi:hypothetical protein
MNTKHTPGPWMESSFEVWSPLNGKRFGKVVANLRRAEAPDDEARANARLIAAAPDGLAANIKARNAIMDLIGSGMVSTDGSLIASLRDAMNECNAAIAKATHP